MKRMAVGIAAALTLAGCAQTTAEGEKEQRTCAVVAGVTQRFSDPAVEDAWYKANRAVTTRVHERLIERYRVDGLVIEPPQGRERELIAAALGRHQCNRLIQVSLDVNVDSAGSYFRFDVTQLAMVSPRPAAGGTIVRTKGLYEKSYRYRRTPEVFRTLSMSEVGDRAYADLEASGTLELIRR